MPPRFVKLRGPTSCSAFSRRLGRPHQVRELDLGRVTVEFLNTTDLDSFGILHGFNARNGSPESMNSRRDGNAAEHRLGPHLDLIHFRNGTAGRGIDDPINLLLLDQIHDIRPPIRDPEQGLAPDAVISQQRTCPHRGKDGKSQLRQPFGKRQHILLFLVPDAEKHVPG